MSCGRRNVPRMMVCVFLEVPVGFWCRDGRWVLVVSKEATYLDAPRGESASLKPIWKRLWRSSGSELLLAMAMQRGDEDSNNSLEELQV